MVNKDLVLLMGARTQQETAMGSKAPTLVRVEVAMLVARPKRVVLMDSKGPMVDRAAVDMELHRGKVAAVEAEVEVEAAVAMEDGVKEVPVEKSLSTDVTFVYHRMA